VFQQVSFQMGNVAVCFLAHAALKVPARRACPQLSMFCQFVRSRKCLSANVASVDVLTLMGFNVCFQF
jgi:hypothetical protein